MKYRKLILAILLILPMLFLALPVSVSAQEVGPKCFMDSNTGDAPFREVACDATMQQIIVLWLDVVDPNLCYNFEGDPLDLPKTDTLDGPECNAWKLGGLATAFTPPVCYVFSGSSSDFDDIDIDRSGLELTPRECNEDLRAAIVAGGGYVDSSVHFDTGQCYVAFTSSGGETGSVLGSAVGEGGAITGYTFMPCARLQEHMEAVDALAAEREATAPAPFASPDAERKKNIDCGTPEDCVRNNSLLGLLKNAIWIMNIIVGVVIVGVIVWAGIEYSSAGSDPNRTASAKNRIRNAIIALVVYIFLEAGLNWMIPGGLF